jgi:hypothetical protein
MVNFVVSHLAVPVTLAYYLQTVVIVSYVYIDLYRALASTHKRITQYWRAIRLSCEWSVVQELYCPSYRMSSSVTQKFIRIEVSIEQCILLAFKVVDHI